MKELLAKPCKWQCHYHSPAYYSEEKKPEAGQAKTPKVPKAEKNKIKKQPKPIKPKEDVFEKLKSIAREKKKSKK